MKKIVDMKAINKIFFGSILLLFIGASCSSDDANNPTFGDQDVPAIYVQWAQDLAYSVGDVIRISPQVSPSDGVTYKWTYNDEVISTQKDLEYSVTEAGSFILKFEAERNGVKNSRTANVLVVKPFVPKQYSKKSIAYITVDGSVADVPWDDITHLIVSSVTVQDDGTLDMTFGGRNTLDLSTLVSTAHNYGVYVMIEASGVMTYVNAMHAYGSLTFYNAAVAANRDAFVNNIVKMVTDNNLDGLNVYMDKADDGAYVDPTTLKDFYEKLGVAMKSGKNTIDDAEYDYFLSMSVYGGWTNATLADMVNIATYDWINVLAFAAEDLTPAPHSATWYFIDQITQWLNWYGVASSRIVGVVPAFGLRYFGNSADYTWGNLWQYTEYIPYRTLCATYANAHEANQQTVDNGIFYDGFPAIEAKAQYVSDNNLGGMALWSVDSDSRDAAKSLMKKINTLLGN
jgi:GH18 family chitinase